MRRDLVPDAGAATTQAFRLYETLGGRLRRTTAFLAARAPGHLTDGRAVPVTRFA
jgi:hypothetical protein